MRDQASRTAAFEDDPISFETLSLAQARHARDALLAALEAMSHFGSDETHRILIGEMLVSAISEGAEAFKIHEMMTAPKPAVEAPNN